MEGEKNRSVSFLPPLFGCLIQYYERSCKSHDDLLFTTSLARFLPASEQPRRRKGRKARRKCEELKGWDRWKDRGGGVEKLHPDEKCQALTNHCSVDCQWLRWEWNYKKKKKIWLNLVEYKVVCKSLLNAATCCNRLKHTEIKNVN